MTGYYLLDRPNPNATARGYQGFWGHPRMNYSPQVLVVHTTEAWAQVLGVDLGAENVANWFATNNVPASYHSLVDSDSTVRCLPAGLDGTAPYTAFHCYGYNSWTLGLSFGMRAAQWPEVPDDWAAKIVWRGAVEAALICDRWGISARWISKAAADGGTYGITGHGTLNPGDRYDPGDGFPWARFVHWIELAKLHQIGDPDLWRPWDQPPTTPSVPEPQPQPEPEPSKPEEIEDAVTTIHEAHRRPTTHQGRPVLDLYHMPRDGAVVGKNTVSSWVVISPLDPDQAAGELHVDLYFSGVNVKGEMESFSSTVSVLPWGSWFRCPVSGRVSVVHDENALIHLHGRELVHVPFIPESV